MADHDLVFYDLEAAPDVRRRLCAPCFRQLEAQPVDEDRAAARWELHAADFAHQLRQGDVQGAWTLLSNFAEDTLTSAVPLDSEASARFAPKEVRRSSAVTPQSRAHTSTKAPSFQGHMERRLRRFARRAQELLHIFEGKGAGRLQAHSDALQLERKLLRSACELRLQGTSPSELRDEALTAAAQLELQASRHRIQRWREELQGNYKRMVSWITRSPGRTSGHDDFEAPVHPIDKRSSSARFGRRSGPAPEVWTLRLPVTGVGISRRIGPRFPLPRSGLTGLFFARSPKLLSTKLQAWTAGRALHWPHFPQCFGPPYLTSGMPRLLSVVFRMPGCRYGFACWRRRREAFALWRSHQQFGAFWLELSTQSCEAGCWCGLTRPCLVPSQLGARRLCMPPCPSLLQRLEPGRPLSLASRPTSASVLIRFK